jgi:hypothetical protein
MSTYLVFIVVSTIVFLAACMVSFVVAKRHGRSGMVYCLAAVAAGAGMDILLQNLGFTDAVTIVGVFLAPVCSIVIAARAHKVSYTS